MHPPGSDATSTGADLVHALHARLEELEKQVRTIPVAADEKALRELRKTLDALAKRDEKFEERIANRVDVVADRMETFARTVSTTSAALAARDGEIAHLRRDLEAHAARVDGAVAQAGRAHDPGALDELRRSVAVLSEQKLPRGIEGRLEDLAAKLALLTERVDTVSSTASTAAARLGGRDGELIALREALDADRTRFAGEVDALRNTFDPRAIAELGQAVSGLARRVADLERTAQQSQLELSGAIDSVGGRLDALDTSLRATVGRLAAGEGSLSALHKRLEDETLRQASALDGLEQSLRSLASRVAVQEDLAGESTRHVDERLAGLAGDVRIVVTRVDTLAAAVTATSEGLAERDDGLERLRRELHESKARVDSLVGDLMQALEGFPGDAIPALETRVAGIAGEVESVLERFEEAERRREALVDEVARTASAADDEHARSDELAARVDSLAAGLDATGKALAQRDERLQRFRGEVAESRDEIDSLVADLTARVARAARAEDLESLRSEVGRRIASIANEAVAEATRSVRDASDDVSVRVGELAARITAADEERERTAAEIARLAVVLDVDRAAVRSRLDALAAAVEGSTAPSATHELEEQIAGLATRFETTRAAVQSQLDAVVDALAAPLLSSGEGERNAGLDLRLEEFSRRLDEVERRGREVASSVSKATTLWPTALRSLEARLDTIAPRPPVPVDGPTAEPRLFEIPQEEQAKDGVTADDPVGHAPASLGRWPTSLASGEP